MIYKCPRCGYECDTINSMKTHLAIKTTCKPIINDIAPNNNNIITIDNDIKCTFCDKRLVNHYSLKRHTDTCKAKKDKEISNRLTVLENQIKQTKIQKPKEPKQTIKSRLDKCANKQCNKVPYYGLQDSLATYCQEHKGQDMINLFTKKCPSCELTSANPKYNNMCVFCFTNLFPNQTRSQKFKRKEKHIMDALLEKIKSLKIDESKLILDKKITGGCSKRRPDFMYDAGTHWICIENDEHQHIDYDTICENKRLCELYIDTGQMNTVVIRFNCDGYTDENLEHNSLFKTDKQTGAQVIVSQELFNKRIDKLYDTFVEHLTTVPDKALTIKYLYYSV